MKEKCNVWEVVLTVVTLAVALVTAVTALLRMEQRIRRLCTAVERYISPKKPADS